MHSNNGQCRCGCKEITQIALRTSRRDGDIKGKHRAYIRGHHARKSPVEYLVEDRGYKTKCWIWQKSTIDGSQDNYGGMYIPETGKMRSAHIVYWERRNGPVPDGKELHHRCEVKSCVNPDHLRPVTRKEHMQIGRKKSALATKLYFAQITHCPHGHKYTEENTHHAATGRQCKICAFYRHKGRLLCALLHPNDPRSRSVKRKNRGVA